MPELLILRHAKSSWKFPELADHDRPLNKRGRTDAPRTGALMRHERLIPDRVLCSTAFRAKETWKRLAVPLLEDGGSPETDFMDEIYHAAPFDLLDILRKVQPGASRVLVVGHNPGLEMLVALLTDERLILPTASLVQMEITGEWGELSCARFKMQWKPREL